MLITNQLTSQRCGKANLNCVLSTYLASGNTVKWMTCMKPIKWLVRSLLCCALVHSSLTKQLFLKILFCSTLGHTLPWNLPILPQGISILLQLNWGVCGVFSSFAIFLRRWWLPSLLSSGDLYITIYKDLKVYERSKFTRPKVLTKLFFSCQLF